MKHEDGFFEGIGDTKLYYQKWLPDTIKGVVLIVHGLNEHSGRYMNVVNALIPEGYAVYIHDGRGQGKSEGRRSHVNRFSDYMDDLGIFDELVRKENPNLPFHLLGHSLGSMVTTHFLAGIDQSKFKSMILSGTGSAPGPAVKGIIIFIAKILSKILPKISIPSGLDPNFISFDPQVVKDYINDPLVETNVTPRLGNESMIYTISMVDNAKMIKVPTLMLNGSEDEAFSGWDELYAAFEVEKDFKKYEGMRHEVYNEPEKEIALNDLKDWINKFN